MVMEINKELIDGLFEQAQVNPRLRQNYDLRTSEGGSFTAYAQCVVARDGCAYSPSSAEHGERFPLVWEDRGGDL